MTPKRLKQLASSGNFIPGIYNYCDRWCERCPFTSRCLTYSMEQEQRRERPESDGGGGGGGGDNPEAEDSAMLDTVSQNFKLALEMVKEDCQERGIDFDEIQKQAKEDVAKNREANRRRRKKRRVNPIVKAAQRYWKGVDKWFKDHRRTIHAKGDELISMLKMELPGQTVEQINTIARDLSDSIDVIRWYQYFISAKLYRAVGQDDDEDDPFEDENPDEIEDPEVRKAVIEARDNDANGSAKIALIAIDKSIDAWTRIREHLPKAGDEIIDFLVQLDRLRKSAQKAFPHARAFVRPGFDDGTPIPGREKPKGKSKRAKGKR
jgi:hypothetical protein